MCWNLWSNSFACLEWVQGVAHASLAESCQSIFSTNVSFARSRFRIVSALNTHSNCKQSSRQREEGREGERVREVKLLATKALVATKPEAAIRLSCCRAATGWQRVQGTVAGAGEAGYVGTWRVSKCGQTEGANSARGSMNDWQREWERERGQKEWRHIGLGLQLSCRKVRRGRKKGVQAKA